MKVGLDVGGTKTDAVAVDDGGAIVGRVRLATGWGPDAVIGRSSTPCARSPPDAGIDATPIRLDRHRHPGSGRAGHRTRRPRREPRCRRARSRRGGRARARCAGARRERRQGRRLRRVRAARRLRARWRYLNLGTGIAAGIVADGELWRGARGTAGEVGHISIDPNGPLCRCGQRGCIEALAGGGAIAERWGTPGALPVRDVFDAADAGDPFARELRSGPGARGRCGRADPRPDRRRRRRSCSAAA